ncbi:hypothetical protein PR202_ga19236 [Eleusine coracana subsp. coracana]|uniref:Reverse transcriptase zinc-binding domain-containing protein n=1 Tax=Eleusine coracana subsp. coracana TaxID=191504 RepID=A0AAV5CUV8_ELECO|nr:hypothetical protein PR202_ga19236 [Eleusine coracana subsp. coracana]
MHETAYETTPLYLPLGMLLSTGNLRKEHLEPVVDKVRGRLPTWKAGFMNKAGRLSLVKSTLSAIPIYPLISIKLPGWVVTAIDKARRGFFWAGEPSASGGKCTMAWPCITRSLDNGGLGIIDLKVASFALNLRWLWLQRVDESRPWIGLPLQCNKEVQAMFDASIHIRMGNGKLAWFWTDRWINNTSIQEMAPDLCRAVGNEAKRSRTVHEAMQGRRWIRDITGNITAVTLVQYFRVRELVLGVTLRHEQEDRILWRWTSSGNYSSKSAYNAYFTGSTRFAGAKLIWKAWAPPKTKLFMYLATHGRTWTSERRFPHGLQDSATCALCDQEPETIEHLLLHCSVAREVWRHALNLVRLPSRFKIDQLGICDTWNRLWMAFRRSNGKEWTPCSYSYPGIYGRQGMPRSSETREKQANNWCSRSRTKHIYGSPPGQGIWVV